MKRELFSLVFVFSGKQAVRQTGKLVTGTDTDSDTEHRTLSTDFISPQDSELICRDKLPTDHFDQNNIFALPILK